MNDNSRKVITGSNGDVAVKPQWRLALKNLGEWEPICRNCRRAYDRTASTSRIPGMYCSRECELKSGTAGISVCLFIFSALNLPAILFVFAFIVDVRAGEKIRPDDVFTFAVYLAQTIFGISLLLAGIDLLRRRAWARNFVLGLSVAGVLAVALFAVAFFKIFIWLGWIPLTLCAWFGWVLWNGHARAAFRHVPSESSAAQ